MKKRVIWFEDEAYYGGNSMIYTGHVYTSGKYTMDIVTELDLAFEEICSAEESGNGYDAIIVDIRFGDGKKNRLGLKLLKRLFQIEADKLEKLKSKIGVFTIERQEPLMKEFQEAGIDINNDFIVVKNYGSLEASAPLLLELIDKIVDGT